MYVDRIFDIVQPVLVGELEIRRAFVDSKDGCVGEYIVQIEREHDSESR